MDYLGKQLLLYSSLCQAEKAAELLSKTDKNQILYAEVYRILGVLSSEIGKDIDR